MANRRPHRRASSSYKGVSWHARDSKWYASLDCNKASYWLGYFATEVDAARAYDAAALQHFGDFARLNFPDEVAS